MKEIESKDKDKITILTIVAIVAIVGIVGLAFGRLSVSKSQVDSS